MTEKIHSQRADWDDGYGYDEDYWYGGGHYPASGGTKSTTSATQTTTTKTPTQTPATTPKKDENMIDQETVKYISEKYEEYIHNLRIKIEEKCADLGVDFNEEFKKIFDNPITF